METVIQRSATLRVKMEAKLAGARARFPLLNLGVSGNLWQGVKQLLSLFFCAWLSTFPCSVSLSTFETGAKTPRRAPYPPAPVDLVRNGERYKERRYSYRHDL